MENNNQQKQISDKLSPIDLRKANASQIEAHIIEFEKFNAKAEVFFDNQRISIDEQMNVLFDVLRIQDYKQYIIYIYLNNLIKKGIKKAILCTFRPLPNG